MSHNPHLKETHRLEKTFKEYLVENKKKFDEIEKTNKLIEKDLNSIRNKVYENIKKNCKSQFDWLDLHATLKFDENGMFVHINENPDGISADAVLGELDVCAARHDYGLRDFFSKTNSQKDSILNDNKSCVKRCTFRSEDRKDHEIKSCVDDCFINSFQNTNYLLNEIQSKLKEIKENLI